jgi:predicted metal-dependent hydrolase
MNIEQTLLDFTGVDPTIKFTIEKESQNHTFPGPYNIPGKKICFEVYLKPTSTDYIIHHELCHLYRHKL